MKEQLVSEEGSKWIQNEEGTRKQMWEAEGLHVEMLILGGKMPT